MENQWKSVLNGVKSQIPAHSFRMWIEPIRWIKGEGNAVVLACPNHFSRKRIMTNYAAILEESLRRVMGADVQLVLEVGAVEPEKPRAGATRPAARSQLGPGLQLELPAVARHQIYGRQLRRDWTFDNFVVGKSNDFAYSASMSLASEMDSRRNSLFLLSGTGMGKSHLSQAIGHRIMDRFPNDRVYYITAEDFADDMIQSFRNDTVDQFKEKYRHQCDVLLLEDIHFLTGKERTQVELSFVLDYLLNAQKRIIFTSCYLPGDIPKINEQLRSRLTGTLVSHIDPPDFQTRMKILDRKGKSVNIRLPRDVAEYLAGELTENVRQLESGLIGVAARSSLTGEPVDIRLAENVVRTIAKARREITVEYIKETVCRHFKVSVEDLVSRSRRKAILRPRHLAIYLSRKYTDQPLQSIGKSFNRYHATAIHSIAVVEKGIKTDTTMRREVEYLCDKIEARPE